MDIKEIEKGDKWFVQLSPKSTLVEREVLDVTEFTVLLKNNDTNSSYNKARYKFSDIEFVESF